MCKSEDVAQALRVCGTHGWRAGHNVGDGVKAVGWGVTIAGSTATYYAPGPLPKAVAFGVTMAGVGISAASGQLSNTYLGGSNEWRVTNWTEVK